jgi:hypothetical protein
MTNTNNRSLIEYLNELEGMLYEDHCTLPPVQIVAAEPPGPRPPPQIAALDPYPTPNRIAIRGEQEAEVLT